MSPLAPNRLGDYSRDRDAKRVQRTIGNLEPVQWPDDDSLPPEWSENGGLALKTWQAYRKSGQADWAQESDLAVLHFTCQSISDYMQGHVVRDKHGQPLVDSETGEVMIRRKVSPDTIRAIGQLMSNLSMTDADRRRVRLELHHEDESKQDVQAAAILEYKRRLGVLDSESKTAGA